MKTKKIFSILAVLGLVAVLSLVAIKGVKQQENNECVEWRQKSKEFVGWYPTAWQIEQCLNYGIEL